MAGTSKPSRSHWPHGRESYVMWRMGGSIDISVTGGPSDTAGLVAFDMMKIPFDCYVKEAWMSLTEGTFEGTAPLLKLIDDTASPQTIIAQTALDTTYDAGTMTELAVADEGPLLTNGVLELQIDSDSNGALINLWVTLFVQPRYS